MGQALSLDKRKKVLEEDDETENWSAWMLESEDMRERARKFVTANSISSGDGEKISLLVPFTLGLTLSCFPPYLGRKVSRVYQEMALKTRLQIQDCQEGNLC